MKKILIALLAASMLFAFTACDDDNGVDYADPELAAALINAIDREKVGNDIVAAAGGDSSKGLTITPSMGGTEEGKTTIEVAVSFTGEGYSNGLRNMFTVTAGEAEVSVTGIYTAATETEKASFVVESYTAEVTTPITVEDTEGAEYTCTGSFSGVASGTIKQTETGFTAENIALTVPEVSAVEVFINGDPVDYAKLCADTGFEPGVDKITYSSAQ